MSDERETRTRGYERVSLAVGVRRAAGRGTPHGPLSPRTLLCGSGDPGSRLGISQKPPSVRVLVGRLWGREPVAVRALPGPTSREAWASGRTAASTRAPLAARCPRVPGTDEAA